MRTFEKYEPLDNLKKEDKGGKTSFNFGTKHMILDGVSLSNLDVTENSSTGTLEGTLLERLDQCYTPFGKKHQQTCILLSVGKNVLMLKYH
jgi:DNA mismatch repair protein MSH6